MKTIYKLFLITIILLTTTLSVNAQAHYRRAVFGDFFAGLTLANMDIQGGNMYKKHKAGFMIGGNVNYKFYHNLQLQSGFYLMKKGSFQHESRTITGQDIGTQRRNIKTKVEASYIQIPLNIGFEVPIARDWFFNMHVGLFGAYGFKGDKNREGYYVRAFSSDKIPVDIPNSKTFEDDSFKRWDYGLGGSVGLVYDIFIMRLQYDYGLANVAHKELVGHGLDDNSLKGAERKTRNYAITFGFRF